MEKYGGGTWGSVKRDLSDSAMKWASLNVFNSYESRSRFNISIQKQIPYQMDSNPPVNS